MSVQDDRQNFCLKALNQRTITLGGVDDDLQVIDANWEFEKIALAADYKTDETDKRIRLDVHLLPGEAWHSPPSSKFAAQSSGNYDKTLRLNFDRLGFNGQHLTLWVKSLKFHPLFSCAHFSTSATLHLTLCKSLNLGGQYGRNEHG